MKILKINPNSDVSLIKAEHRRLAKLYHPDNKDTGNTELFKILQAEYEFLINNKPLQERSKKAKPRNVNKYKNRNRIFRILSGRDREFTVHYPSKEITEDTVFHFMYGTKEFDVFADKNLPLPQMITVNFNNAQLKIKVIEEPYERF